MGFVSMRAAPPCRRQLRHWEQVCFYLGAQPYRAVLLPLPADPPMSVRLFKRMALGVVMALEVQDGSVASASLRQLGELIAMREVERLEVRKASVLERERVVPPWVEAGMGASIEQPARVRHLIQMLLGIFAAYGVLALKDKPATSVGDLLTQHLELLEAEDKGGVGQMLWQHFARSTNKRCLATYLARSGRQFRSCAATMYT